MRRFNFGRNRKEEEKGLELVPFKRFDIESLFGDFFERPFAGFDLLQGFERPAIDVYEKDSKVIVKADLPGIKKENIRLHLDRGILTITGETKAEKEQRKKGYYYSERSFGKVQRSIRLPEGARENDIKASYKDGVLSVEIPKAEGLEQKGRDIDLE